MEGCESLTQERRRDGHPENEALLLTRENNVPFLSCVQPFLRNGLEGIYVVDNTLEVRLRTAQDIQVSK
jgi:hypothetical protein